MLSIINEAFFAIGMGLGVRFRPIAPTYFNDILGLHFVATNESHPFGRFFFFQDPNFTFKEPYRVGNLSPGRGEVSDPGHNSITVPGHANFLPPNQTPRHTGTACAGPD